MKKQNYTEIEERIEARIAELEEEYELDTYDIQEIRDEEYRLGGWSYDPFPEIEEEEEEEEEEWHYRSLEQQLNEVGMSGESSYTHRYSSNVHHRYKNGLLHTGNGHFAMQIQMRHPHKRVWLHPVRRL